MTPYVQGPHSAYQRLCESDPVHWEPTMRLWVVTRYADVVSMLRDHRFSADHTIASDFVPAAQATISRSTSTRRDTRGSGRSWPQR